MFNSEILLLIIGEDQNDVEFVEKQEDLNEFSEIQPVVSIEEFDNHELIKKGKWTYSILTDFFPSKFMLTKFLFIITLGGGNEKSSKAGYCPHCAKVHNIFFYIVQNNFILWYSVSLFILLVLQMFGAAYPVQTWNKQTLEVWPVWLCPCLKIWPSRT